MNLKKSIALILCCCSMAASAQIATDTTTRKSVPLATTGTKKDSVVKDSARLAIERMPRQAAIRSAILPGLGQVYNKRWWKVPLIYGGFVTLGVVYNFNQQNYKKFLGEVQYRQANKDAPLDPQYTNVSTEGLIRVKDQYRRDRDLTIIGSVGFYAINIIDAYIDAKFFRFDISEELSIQTRPSLIQSPTMHASQSIQPGLTFKISL